MQLLITTTKSMARLRYLNSILISFFFVLVFISAGLIFAVKVHAGYSFGQPGTINYIPTCQNCTYGECIKKDSGYVCGGSNNRTDVEWTTNCDTTPLYTSVTGGSCPVGQTCSQYLSKGACTNNRCILVNNIPEPPTPTPTVYGCGERRSAPNQCSVDYSYNPARYVGCGAGQWCKQYASSGGANPDTECRVLCGAGYTYAPGSVCQCVPIANDPIGWIDGTNGNNCTIFGWTGDMGDPKQSNTVQYQIYKSGTAPGALSGTFTANGTTGAAVCMALYGNNGNYTDLCNQCNTNPALPQCKHGYNITITGTPATDGQQYDVRTYGNNIPGSNGVAQVQLSGSPKTISCNKAPGCSGVSASTTSPVLGTSVTFTANVSDATGIVNNVTFYRTTNSISCAGRTVIPNAVKINNTTWQVTLNTAGLTIGTTYQIYAVVNDNGQPQMSCSGNNTCTTATTACSNCNTSITIQTNNQPPQCSSMTISSEAPVQGTSVTVTANVSDATGEVNNVTFYRTTDVASCANPTEIPNPQRIDINTWAVTIDTTDLSIETTYFIHAVVNDNGTPSLACTGKTSCQPATPSCANCKTQFTVATPCNDSLTISAGTPACNRVEYTINGTKPSGYVADALTGVTTAGGAPDALECTYNNNNAIYTCRLKTAEAVTLTHTYKKALGTGQVACSVAQGFDGTTLIEKPVCVLPPAPGADVYLTTNPPSFPYNTTGVELIAAAQNTDTISILPKSVTWSGFSSVIPTLPVTPPVETIPPGPKAKYTWTATAGLSEEHSFEVAYSKFPVNCSAYPDLVNNDCKVTSNPITVEIPKGYFLVEGGTAHINEDGSDVLMQTGFNSTKSFATSQFSILNTGINSVKLNDTTCGAYKTICSLRELTLFNYHDKNTIPNWYATILANSKGNLGVIYDASPAGIDYYDIPGSKDIFQVKGDLSISENDSCTRRTAFFVDGDLTITPSFTLSGSIKDNGCIFFVQGKTIIQPGSELSIDEIDAFIVTNDFEIKEDTANHRPLQITGGVITHGKNTFSRNRNYFNGSIIIESTEPSEIIKYEGARYIRLFKGVISTSGLLTIRESQYTK